MSRSTGRDRPFDPPGEPTGARSSRRIGALGPPTARHWQLNRL
ncbi:MAG TPA: hypothetical protein VGE74_11655 [Gemmata sp.]